MLLLRGNRAALARDMVLETDSPSGYDIIVVLIILAAIGIVISGIGFCIARCCRRWRDRQYDKEKALDTTDGESRTSVAYTTRSSSAPTLFDSETQACDDELQRRMAILMATDSPAVHERQMSGQEQQVRKDKSWWSVALPMLLVDLIKGAKRPPVGSDSAAGRQAELSVVEPALVADRGNAGLPRRPLPSQRSTSTTYEEPFQFASDVHSEASSAKKSAESAV